MDIFYITYISLTPTDPVFHTAGPLIFLSSMVLLPHYALQGKSLPWEYVGGCIEIHKTQYSNHNIQKNLTRNYSGTKRDGGLFR